MRKSELMRANYLRGVAALIMGILSASCLGWGQQINAGDTDKGASTAAGASSAKELMLLAAKQNGLEGDDIGPWHLKGSYKSFDEAGSVTNEGTYEEFWVSAKKYKRIFTGKAFTDAEYGTEKGMLRVGNGGQVPLLLSEAVTEFTNPLPNPDMAGKGTFELKELETSGVKLECLKSTGLPVNPDKTYCLGAEKPFVRIISLVMEREQILHNRILAFHDRFIAGDLQFVIAGRQRLTAHVESIESLNPVDEAMFTPPPDAVFVPKLVNISAGVAQGMLLKKVTPEYPSIAKNDHVTGTVVIQATIGKDGHIKDEQVVSGPSELQYAATDSVRQWLYRPFLLNGEPVEVRTTINVIFTLGR